MARVSLLHKAPPATLFKRQQYRCMYRTALPHASRMDCGELTRVLVRQTSIQISGNFINP